MPKIMKAKPEMVYLGIDPGLNGGLAAISNRGVVVEKMPPTERDVWDWFQSQIQVLTTRYHEFSGLPCMAVIEKVQGYIGGAQPGSAMFKFGMSYGGLRMALIAGGISFEEVPPQRWQKLMGIPVRTKTESKGDHKNKLKARAQQLFPAEKVTLATADALLLALYCKRKHEGTL